MKINKVKVVHTVNDDCGNPKSRSLTAKLEEGDDINLVIQQLEEIIWKELADREHQDAWRETTRELKHALIEQAALYKKGKAEYDRFLAWAKQTGTFDKITLTNFSNLFPTLEAKLAELEKSHGFNRQLQAGDLNDISF